MNNKEIILSLRKDGKSYRDIEKLTNISRATISYHCKSMGINEPINGQSYDLKEHINIDELKEYYSSHTMIETCKYFKMSKSSVIKYADSKRVKLCDDERKKRNYEHVKNRVQKLKEMGVEYLGGKCSKCGYCKCISALEFHHNNPDEKEFTISSHPSRSWDKLKVELDKCQLLCSNCHRELHYNLLNA